MTLRLAVCAPRMAKAIVSDDTISTSVFKPPSFQSRCELACMKASGYRFLYTV